MKPLAKTALVLAGYGIAGLMAAGVVGLYSRTTHGPDQQASSAMYAFGDGLLFLAIFTLLSIPVSGTVLYFLRPYRAVWWVASSLTLTIAATGTLAVASYLVSPQTQMDSVFPIWSRIAPLRILLAPLFALGFFLSALLAPTRFIRTTFLVAAILEAVVFVWMGLIWLGPFR